MTSRIVASVAGVGVGVWMLWTGFGRDYRERGLLSGGNPPDTVRFVFESLRNDAPLQSVWTFNLRSDNDSQSWLDPAVPSLSVSDEVVLVPDQRENRVLMVNASTGRLSESLGTLGQGAGQVWGPSQAVELAGKTWIADAGNQRLVAISRTADSSPEIRLPGAPVASVVDGADQLVVAVRTRSGATLVRVQPQTGVVRAVPSLSYRAIYGIAISGFGTLGVVGWGRTLDVYQPDLPPTVASGSFARIRTPAGADTVGSGGVILAAAPVVASRHWWVALSDGSVACIDLDRALVLARWYPTQRDMRDVVIGAIASTADGVLVFHAFSKRVSRYLVGCS